MSADADEDVADAPEVHADVIYAVVSVLDLLVGGASEELLKKQINYVANHYAPQEVKEIYRLLAETAAPQTLPLMARLAPQWQYFISRKAAVYEREILMRGAILYRSAVAGAERGALVAFAAGPMGNLFMANIRFLVLLGHLPIDVLILSNGRGAHGRWNMGGPGSKYVALERVKALLADRGIRPRCYIGASAGAEPALVAATLDPGSLGITLSGRLFRPGRSVPLAQAPPAFLPICACWPRPGRLYAIYNAQEPLDIISHQHLAGLAPHVRIYQIPDDATHNPLVTLAGRGKLRRAFDQIGAAAFGQEPDFDFVCEA